jgi:hypothetical protein
MENVNAEKVIPAPIVNIMMMAVPLSRQFSSNLLLFFSFVHLSWVSSMVPLDILKLWMR